MATSEELAWAAGFIDGEGCIHIARATHRKYVNYNLCLRVTQKDPRPIAKLEQLFGGFVSTYKASRYTRGEQWIWSVTNAAAGRIIESLLPYLILKKNQGELALAFQALRSTTSIRDTKTGQFKTFDKTRYHKMYEQMRELKKEVVPYGLGV